MKITNDQREAILNALREADANAYRHPNCEYRVYIDSDGEVGSEEWLARDNGFYQFRDGYYRNYVATLCHQYYSILWDCWYLDGFVYFAEDFKERFGIDLLDNEDDLNAEQLGEKTCKEHGIPVGEYCEWLEEKTEEAIEEAVRDGDNNDHYDALIDLWEREEEMYENW